MSIAGFDLFVPYIRFHMRATRGVQTTVRSPFNGISSSKQTYAWLKPQAPGMLRKFISKISSEKDPTRVAFKRQCPWQCQQLANHSSSAKKTDDNGKAFPEISKAQNTPIPIKVMAATLNSKLTPDDGAAPCADDLAGTFVLKRCSKNKKRERWSEQMQRYQNAFTLNLRGKSSKKTSIEKQTHLSAVIKYFITLNAECGRLNIYVWRKLNVCKRFNYWQFLHLFFWLTSEIDVLFIGIGILDVPSNFPRSHQRGSGAKTKAASPYRAQWCKANRRARITPRSSLLQKFQKLRMNAWTKMLANQISTITWESNDLKN